MARRAATEGRPYGAVADGTVAEVEAPSARPDGAVAEVEAPSARPDGAIGKVLTAGLSLGVWAWFAVASVGCGAASFIEAGEQTRPAVGRVRASDALDLETVAWPAPVLSPQPPDLLAGAAVPLTVASHEERRGVYRLTLLPEVGEPVLLEYRLGVGALAGSAGYRLPVEPGEALLWRLPLDERQEPTGLLVRESDGTLRALVVIGETLGPLGGPPGDPPGGADGDPRSRPAGDKPGPLDLLGLTPDFSAAALVYSETTAVMSCLIAVDHHALKVSDGRDTLWVRPGTSRLLSFSDLRGRPRVRLSAETADPGPPDGAEDGASQTFELLVFDVSRSQLDQEDPRCARKSHVSWALLRAPTP